MDGESQAQREARLRSLWEKLDTKRKGNLDYEALKRGLVLMNHPLKDADGLIKDMLTSCDIDHDGKISYDEFTRFCTRTEKELWQLFKSIDRDNSGNLDKSELSAAFERAGVAVSNARLDRFFSYIDKDHDGTIDFGEWRDFLLFMPTNAPGLKAVFSYYQSTSKLTSEGDVVISDEALQGLGTIMTFLKTSLFGAITQLVKPSQGAAGGQNTAPITMWEGSEARPQLFDIPDYEEEIGDDPYIPIKPARRKELEEEEIAAPKKRQQKLTDFVPDVGYFIAGGVSGITSRTATAPLDRLKVYLIAQTGDAKDTKQAVKSGKAISAAQHGVRTLWNACKELWAAGGMRSLFAGNGINVVKVMPESSVKFGAYEAAKRAIAKVEGHGNPKQISSSSTFIAGGCAGMIAQAVVYPLDTLKFQMQCETVAGGEHGSKLILHTAKKMWARNGMIAFYKGLPMGLVGMFPYAAIDLSVFETLKKRVIARNKRNNPNLKHDEDALPGNFSMALMGGFSGAIGASIVYPLNLLRTRLQSQGTVSHPRTYTGIVDVTRQTLQGEGVRGLFKGLTPNLLKVVPAVSITYVVYENTKKALHLS
ncbi:Calcium-binding mitochondrial carrier SAL1 [Pseudocercospora fuligena]|uniref:Mitochondrial thiamine pyrophosphate carrier 1 n=1 Tax=Pseudocercospora fuligena TaxID=685502 RepID=A0A8H6VQY0_9PEZI|nr:Calcium-binding mitochondrial carrier SAL1 [Pseudocercospora fuligena]